MRDRGRSQPEMRAASHLVLMRFEALGLDTIMEEASRMGSVNISPIGCQEKKDTSKGYWKEPS